MAVTLYGIANCDKVKKARAWLEQHGVAVQFHDFKKQGISMQLVDGWLRQVDWSDLVNRSGTTWRQLPAPRRTALATKQDAIELMLEKPSVIRRPVADVDGRIHIGFDADNYSTVFGKR